MDNSMSGKTVEMWVDGLGKLTCIVIGALEDPIVGKCFIVSSKGAEFRIPVSKIGIHRVVSDKPVELATVQIWMCKNDTAGCKGVKVLSAKTLTLVDMPCDCKERESIQCDFGCVGKLFQLPIDLQAKFLEGMTTGHGPYQAKMEAKKESA